MACYIIYTIAQPFVDPYFILDLTYEQFVTRLETCLFQLRNVAKSGCQTEYTFVPDIDMIPIRDGRASGTGRQN